MSDGRYRGGPDTASHGRCIEETAPVAGKRHPAQRGMRDDVVHARKHDPRSEDYEDPRTGTTPALPEAPAQTAQRPASLRPPGPAGLPVALVQRLDEAQALHARLPGLN